MTETRPTAVSVRHLKTRMPAMLDDLEALVTCESPTADRAAVARCADVVAALGRRLTGTTPERLQVGGTPHLRWRFGHRSEVLLLGHCDTVWPIGSLATHPWSHVDGIVRGPGCFDMKAGIVQMFHALAALDDLTGVSVLVTGDEEIGSPTSQALIEEEARRCRAVLVAEPSGPGGALKIARKGAACYEVRVHGRAAHAGLEPQNGANAALELARQLLRLDGVADAAQGTTVTPTMLAGGTASNTVPALATASIDVRASTAAEQDRVDHALRTLVAHDPRTKVEAHCRVSRRPLESAMSQALFDRARVLAADLGLGELPAMAVGGASDGNLTAGVGTPTLDGLGAVGGGAHADDEHVVVDNMPRRTVLLAGLIDDLRCSQPALHDPDHLTKGLT